MSKSPVPRSTLCGAAGTASPEENEHVRRTVIADAAQRSHRFSGRRCIQSASCAHRSSGRKRRDPSLPRQHSGRATRRPPPPHRGDPVARPGDGHGPIAGRADSRTFRSSSRYWGTDYDWRKAEAKLNALAAVHDDDRRPRHPLHPRPLPSPNALPLIMTHGWPGSVFELAQDRRSAHGSHGAWWTRGGRFRSRPALDAGLRLLRQADRARAGIPTASPAPGRS